MLFGFALTFTLIVKIPLVGVFAYGIAEASTAYLITKITDPPPPPSESQDFIASQVHWKNKHEFMSLPIAALDGLNVKEKQPVQSSRKDYPSETFS